MDIYCNIIEFCDDVSNCVVRLLAFYLYFFQYYLGTFQSQIVSGNMILIYTLRKYRLKHTNLVYLIKLFTK